MLMKANVWVALLRELIGWSFSIVVIYFAMHFLGFDDLFKSIPWEGFLIGGLLGVHHVFDRYQVYKE